MRFGTSSYIIPEDILPNVEYLAGKVKDVELILFEVDDGMNNIPSSRVIDRLCAIACEADLSYTVHLPLDLRLGSDGDEQHESLLKAKRVIEATKDLQPWAYVLHLDGREVKSGVDRQAYNHWLEQATRALQIVGNWAGGVDFLAVENLEGYALDFWEPVFERIPAGRCVDVGHLWRDGHDPIPYLERAFSLTRVVHIHGIGERDHQSLALVPPDELARVLEWLYRRDFNGVITVEVFGEDDFISSMAAIKTSRMRNGF
jgi:sugar phosphate isomerase/epimerase